MQRVLLLASGLLILVEGTALAQPGPAAPPAAPAPAEAPSPAPAETVPSEPPAPEPAPTPAPSAEAAPAPVAVPIEPAPETPAVVTTEPEPAGRLFNARIGGYVQPQVRVRQDSKAQNDEDGFRLRRARLTLAASAVSYGTDLAIALEGELTPELDLLDAYVTAARTLRHEVRLALDLGQVKAPISRQTLLSDAFLSFPDKAELAALAPDRQLGARLVGDLPQAYVRWMLGMFNGEGRNLVQNTDQGFLYAARFEVKPIGYQAKLRESAFEGTHLTIGGSVGRNRRSQRNETGMEVGREDVVYLGADLAGAWNGLSGSVEYLEVRHDFDDLPQPNFHANGLAAQLAYLLPLPGFLRDRFEVGARVEEIDRNDFVPIERPGDLNQSLRYYTGVVSYYQAGHDLKVQLSYSHIQEVEDRDRNNLDATYANDTLLVQASYRME